MPNPTRPDPDALLASLKQAEAKAARGRLKIFFGMAPGVGKTYAMLEAARKAHAEGVDVAVALVETHGREETQRLLEGLPVVPRKLIAYRGTRWLVDRSSFEPGPAGARTRRFMARLLSDALLAWLVMIGLVFLCGRE